MSENALFLQKPELLPAQLPQLKALFGEFLPQYTPFFAGRAAEVPTEVHFSLLISPYLPLLPEVMRRIPKPAQLHFTSSGTDFLPQLREEADLDGIRITASAGVNAVSIAEHALGCMLTFAKNLHLYRDQQQQRLWKRYWHQEIRGQHVCIIGMGHIGRALAERCRAMGMQVTGCVRSPREEPLTDQLILFEALETALPAFDYVVLSLPLTQHTRGFFGQALLTQMKPESVLINVARGALLDEEALTETLQQKKIKGAALDVFSEEPLPDTHPFWALSNLLLTPHVAGTTQHYMRNMFEILARQLP
ncbi:Phosphoglycerate dehydrogenase [Cyclonatronum proteinivorum]|uniref:Phosphoglycerate dehydrogenase n=1 Tax=Cyclonatronum proteinivorum TaxID=1457365 RepID=A0A345UMN1_9BACT|nr:D-2-hydroxyacid dehydrogenase [Cyclonatronum proteinivorum]AXJ01733.1 Phosphoglycerate dehydrogenase [Cyclonatronum proteinivorum]